MLHERDEPGDRPRALALVDQALATFEELGMKKDRAIAALALKLGCKGYRQPALRTSIEALPLRLFKGGASRLPPHAAPDGTVTIMFSDIEDSTVLTERLGDQAWQELLRKHNALIREQLQAHGGYEVKTMGDGFMVAFQSAKKGLDCAIAIQRAFAEHNAADGEHVKVRIGLHAGEAIKDGDDFYGKNVIMASRVAGRRRRRDPRVVAATPARREQRGRSVVCRPARGGAQGGLPGVTRCTPSLFADRNVPHDDQIVARR